MMNPAILIRPQNLRTSQWLRAQSDHVRRNTGRRLGYGPTAEACLNGLCEAGIDFSDCHSMSDISAKLVRIVNRRYLPVPDNALR